MADYFSPTVIQPTIPVVDITALERLLLSHIFNAEPDGEGLYFYADEGPVSMIWLDRARIEAALAELPKPSVSAAADFATEQLVRVPETMSRSNSTFRLAGNSSSRTSCATRQACAMSQPSRPSPARKCGPTVSAAWLSSSPPIPLSPSRPMTSLKTS